MGGFSGAGRSKREPTSTKAVNLGEDTDTVAAVAGGLAGALYGYRAIPTEWRQALIKRTDIEGACLRFTATLCPVKWGLPPSLR